MKQIEVRRENKIKRNAGEQILQAIIYLIIICCVWRFCFRV